MDFNFCISYKDVVLQLQEGLFCRRWQYRRSGNETERLTYKEPVRGNSNIKV